MKHVNIVPKYVQINLSSHKISEKKKISNKIKVLNLGPKMSDLPNFGINKNFP